MIKKMLAGKAGRAGGAGLILLALAAIPRAQSKVPHFEFDPAFPQMPAGKVFGDVSSVTADSQNHISNAATAPSDPNVAL